MPLKDSVIGVLNEDFKHNAVRTTSEFCPFLWSGVVLGLAARIVILLGSSSVDRRAPKNLKILRDTP